MQAKDPSSPAISVIVASHNRPVRLRWLLNALEEQTLPREEWEVVVSHDSTGPETERLLDEHPLALDGTLRHVALEPGSAPPGANRNAALALARAPIVAFTDDDCRPPDEWLERALAAGKRHPGAIVQGRTEPDPDEWRSKSAWHTSQYILSPPSPNAETCNIVYPRELVERLGGFDETMPVGEDTDLALRAVNEGVDYMGDPSLVTYHAIHDPPFLRRLEGVFVWRDLPALIVRHPEVRAAFPLRTFWKRTHVWIPLGLAGLVRARRQRSALALLAPWILATTAGRGALQGRIQAMPEVPARMAVDSTEFLAMVWGSLKHRRVLL